MSSFIPFTDFQNKMDYFTIVKGKKKNREEEKNVLVLSAVGLSRGSFFFFFLFWMKSGILLNGHSQSAEAASESSSCERKPR